MREPLPRPVDGRWGRRSALTLLALPVLAATGCAPVGEGAGGPADRTGSTPPGDAVADDAALLAAAVAATDRVRADLATAARRHPSLRTRLAAAQRVHAAHRAVLADAGEGGSAAPSGSLPPTRSPDDALLTLARREAALADRLAAAALGAASGSFARLLASCAAAAASTGRVLVAMDAVVPAPPLPDPLPGGRPLDGAAVAVADLQGALAAEHAAVWSLGVLGARTSRAARPSASEALLAAYRAHRTRRDLLEALLRGLGEDPVAQAAAYALPASGTAAQVTASARAVEAACGTWWAAVVATSTGATRSLATSALTDAALRGLPERGHPSAFPGAAELADP